MSKENRTCKGCLHYQVCLVHCSESVLKNRGICEHFLTPDSLVKRGRWGKAVESKLDAHTGEYWEEEYYNCLECDYASDWKSPYCPNCGALMED